ncbi:MAG: regulator [Planctomycetes bacterium B3_Pla]|nr:MAG: regulator [Planctomycetes bacterium B3_Pla]
MIFGSEVEVVNPDARLSGCALETLILSLSLALSLSVPTCLGGGVADTPFVQEYHEAYTIGQESASNDVRAIAVDGAGEVWVGTKTGVYRLDTGKKQWVELMGKAHAGPVYDIVVDHAGTVWVGAWNGMYRSAPDGLKKLEQIDHPITALCAIEDQVIGLGAGGIWRIADDACTYEEIPYSKHFRAVLPDGHSGFWIATGLGLYHHTDAGHKFYQAESELLGPDVQDIAYAPDGSLWIGGLGGITVYKGANRVHNFTPNEGLPSVSIRCVGQGSDGLMWVGTDRGVARYDGRNWSLRHSKRWLLSDDVRDIAFDPEGNAWIATGNGVSAIKRRSMTLAEKGDYFLDVCLARHVREPGLVEKCLLGAPGDTSTWKPRDDDNDGQYTAMYLAMESFRYAATKDPQAKANAKKAFEALRFLQTVTGTPGFVARTVVPSNWTRMADPNRKISDRQWAEMYVQNPREKRVETRWHPSADGKWLWKGDTSSDEITGHMFGYLFYYDLVADDTERQHAGKHVLKIIDYIIENGYVLKDLDGTHTKWGVWAPERLNDDPDWTPERGVNSVEILSFLKLAYHVSGDLRYQNEYSNLLYKHDYAANVRRAKTYNPTWRTHIDDELLALAYPSLLLHEKDPKLRRLYRESIDHWYAAVKADCSPFFDFIYGACADKAPQLEMSAASLRDASLDLVRWTVDNSRREDISLVRIPEREHLQTNRLLPPSERGVIRWDENPWKAVQGDGGRTESDGVWWLLPYWMGRHYSYIQPPGGSHKSNP